MTSFIFQLLVAGVIMGLVDGVWLGVVANKLYKKQLGSLLAKKPNMLAAVLFYIVFVVGVVVFAVQPASHAQQWQVALGLGSLLGLVTYGTYDLTNLATLKGFPVKIVAIDMVWGVVLTGVVATLTYLITV